MFHLPPPYQLGAALAEGESVSPDDELKNSLLQFRAWNIQGKTVACANNTLGDFSMDLHALAFQEVGGCGLGLR